MSSITSVGSSASNAAAQYQDYLKNLQNAKKLEKGSDNAAIAKAEALSPASDPDHDGE